MRPLYNLSPFNTLSEVTKNIHFNKNLTLCDCTLRDGEQQAGVVFTKEDKVAIAKLLDEMRIPEIEAGMPCNSQEDADAIDHRLLQAFPDHRLCARPGEGL